jgi:hypothetical protein
LAPPLMTASVPAASANAALLAISFILLFSLM